MSTRNAAWQALEQFDAELVPSELDALGEGRLGDVQIGSGERCSYAVRRAGNIQVGEDPSLTACQTILTFEDSSGFRKKWESTRVG